MYIYIHTWWITNRAAHYLTSPPALPGAIKDLLFNSHWLLWLLWLLGRRETGGVNTHVRTYIKYTIRRGKIGVSQGYIVRA